MTNTTLPTPVPTGPQPESSAPAASPGRILLVEDNPDIRFVTQRILVTRGFEVNTASDGEEALEKARSLLPEIILLDVMLPGIDGLEVCRRLKADPLTRGIMIIHVTGRGSVDQRIEGFDAGADDYIPKPFHLPELLARLRSSLRIKRLTDDLAERNRLLQKSQDALIQSEKLAVIGLLASGISHEFNNIMAGISGYAQLAKKNPKFRDTLVDVALVQTERALEITRSLSSYNRQTDGKSSCDAVAVIESALCLVVKEVERTRAEIETDFVGRPLLDFRAAKLQEVVLNMVLNALQALGAEGGKVRISVRPASSAGNATITIADNGAGIQPQDLGKIFDPFFTTKGALGGGQQFGTGLGLSVCKNLVEAGRGSIEVSSRPGEGTTFCVTLPLATQELAPLEERLTMTPA